MRNRGLLRYDDMARNVSRSPSGGVRAVSGYRVRPAGH
jgi:hypothetical protein